MAAPTAEHPQQRPQGLPGINSLTNGIPPPQQQQRLSTDQHVSPESTRDSGTWPQPHTSKRELPLKAFLPWPCSREK